MSTTPVNETEEFVLGVCQRSFLSLWCYNNPRGKHSGELCDILVICDPYIVIVSVKDIELKQKTPTQVHHKRWTSKAIDASIRQIYGAQRWLVSASRVIRSDGSLGLALPPLDRRKVHRIAVAFGSRSEVSIGSGDFGKGYVHVMTEASFQDLLDELDTVTDMMTYLGAKEALAKRCSILMTGTEKDLLAFYLLEGRVFPEEPDYMVVMDDIWKGLRQRSEYQLRKTADEVSYTWDRLIEFLSDTNAKSIGEVGAELTEIELALRVMARENRLGRRILGQAVRDFLEQAREDRLRSRITHSSISNVVYVLAYFKAGEVGPCRISELGTRCLIARQRVGRRDAVVGIGIGEFKQGVGSTSDLVYIDTNEWSADAEAIAMNMQRDHRYFASAPLRHAQVDEWPTAP